MPVEHTYRVDGFGAVRTSKLNPVKAIRQMCRECYGFAPSWVVDIKECPSEMCPLHPFRYGYDPGRPVSKKQREASRRNAASVGLGTSVRGQKRDFGSPPMVGDG